MPTLTVFTFAPPPVALLGSIERLVLRAARSWVMLASRRASPRPAMAALLGPAGGAFSAFMDQLTRAWPDPFTTFPPCAGVLAPDEAALLALLADAGADDRARTDARLADLLPESVRGRLFDAARRVADDMAAGGAL